MKKVLLIILALVCVLGLTACDMGSIFNTDTHREYELTYDYLDGNESVVVSILGNEAIDLPEEPTRDGYTFKGWYFDNGLWQKRFTAETFLLNPVYHNKTVYARWEEIDDDSQLDLTYRIQFQTNGGSSVNTVNTNRIAVSPATTRQGYTFLGWFLYETLTFKISFPYVPNNDITLYAGWKEDTIDIEVIQYTISFAAGDTVGGEISGTLPPDQLITRNNELRLPANTLTKQDHDFIGWSDGRGIYAVGEAFTVTADTLFTARWRLRVAPATYQLSFGQGEGEGITGTAPLPASYEAYENITLPNNPFLRRGYQFVGWYDATANETHQAGATYITKARAAILVAKWQIVEYAVTYYNIDNATNAQSNPASYTINTPTFTIAAPTLTGYSFEGWYADAAFTTLAQTTITTGSIGEIKIYALWKRVELSMQLNSQGNYVITGYTSNSTEIVVPEKIDNIPVTEIAAGAFRNCTTLITLVIPSSVVRIGAGIVNGCHNLTNLTVPFIGEYASGATARNSVLGYLFGEVPLSEPGAVLQSYTDTPSFAFAINNKIQTITLTAASTISAAALQNVASLKTINLNKGITVINRLAFSGCTSLENVNFGAQYSILTVGANAFENCTSLTTLALPNTVTNIGGNCFAGSGIKNLTIPQSVVEIGGGILADTSIATLTTPYIGKSKFQTTGAEGVLGYFFKTAASGVTQYLSDTETAIYNIPSSLRTINIRNATRLMYGTLSNCTNITTLTLNSSLTIISDYALYNTGISGVVLNDGLTTIGGYAFANSKQLATIIIPNTLVTLGTGAFEGCTDLYTATFSTGSRITAIPNNCFKGCTSLVNLSLHDGIRTFGDYAFQGCSSLVRANISAYTTSIGAYAFADCVSLSSGRTDGAQSIIISASTTSIGAYAFANCTSIRLLTFTAGVLTNIGNYAFANCTGIGTTDSGVRRTTIVIPNSVLSIGDYAFYNCSNVARLDLNRATAKLTNIGAYAFANWTTLGRNLEGESTMDKLEIPASVITIGDYAFANAVNMRQLGFEGNKLVSIGSYAFFGASSLGITLSGAVNENFVLTIPDTVTNIGAYAFAGTAAAPIKVRSIVLSQDSNLISIGDYAFAYCNEITQIYIGKQVNNIGEGALRGTARLSDIRVSVNNINFLSDTGNLYTRSGSISPKLIKYATGKTETTFTVAANVSEIGSYAFESDKSLTRITLPSTVMIINKNAFEGSSAEIIFTNPTITQIGEYVFNGYMGSSINLPSTITTLGNYALAGAAITSITLPSSVKNIGSYVFANTPITQIFISSSVITINAAAFAGCGTLAEIIVDEANSIFSSFDGVLYEINPDGLTLVQYPAAKQDAQYTIANNVTVIKANAFEGANNITTLIVPDTVTRITAASFKGLNNLQHLSLPFVGVSDEVATTLGAMFGTTASTTPDATRQGTEYYLLPQGLVSITLSRAPIIANYAFQNLDIQQINLGGMVSAIGIYAFDNCTAAITLGANSPITNIGSYAFARYKGASITIPYKVTTIAEYAFYEASITQLIFAAGSEIATIGQYAFAGTNLTSLVIPSTATTIGRSILEGVGDMNTLQLPFVGGGISDTENTLGYLFGTSSVPIEGGIAQTKNNGITIYSKIPSIQNIRVTAAINIPVGAFMNVSAATITLDKVQTIRSYAFTGCAAQVVFGAESNMTTIDADAFRNYKYNGSFVLPATVQTILQNAFYNASIRDIQLGAVVNSIGNYAFAYCANLGITTSGLVLPSSLEAIGDGAFYATGIKSVTIPANVSSIGYSAFGMCSQLIEIKVAQANSFFKDTNGSLYSKDGTILKQYPANASATSVTIPSGVQIVAAYAFAGNISIEAINIPSSLTTIEEYAFAGTQSEPMGLSSIIFSGVSNLNMIDRYAFAFCTALTSVSIPKPLKEIGEGAFSGSLRTPMALSAVNFAENADLASVGANAFAYNTQLHSFILPRSIIEVGPGILKGCTSLEALTIPYVGASRSATAGEAVLGYFFGEADEGTSGATIQYYSATDYGYFDIPQSLASVNISNVTGIGYGAFYNCSMISVLTLGQDILTIGDYAFYACTSLRNISIPSRTISIGSYAFAGTSNRPMSIETVTIPQGSNLSTIGIGAFYNCVSLDSFSLPANVSKINDYTFYNSRGLTQFEPYSGSRLESIGSFAFYNSGLPALTLPQDVRTIGESAFENSALSSFGFSTGGIYRLTSIGDRAFANCASLTSMFIPSSLSANGMGDRVFYNSTGLVDVVFASGGALASLGEYSFYNCTSLQTITLPQSLAAIGDYQFYGSRSLTTIAIPATVQSIGAYAFAGKDGVPMGLNSVVFVGNSTLSSIGAYAFNLCYSLASITLPDSLLTIGERAFYNCNALSSLAISPQSLLTSIGNYAFSGCVSMSGIFIPQYVSDIGTGAFFNTGLTSIQVSEDNAAYMSHEGNLLTKDGKRFIKYASANPRTEYDLPSSVTTISGYAFADTKNLTTLNLEYGLVNIEDYAFSGASGLISLTIPETVATIGAYAFAKATKLVSFVFDGNSRLSSLGANAFFNCESLVDIILPADITVIADGLFYGCTSLYRVGMGYVTKIGNSAFYGNSRLTQIILPITLQYIGDYAFYNCASLPNFAIGSQLSYIGAAAFAGCQSLTRFDVAQDNPVYVSDNGVLYTYNYSELLIYPAGKQDTTFVINNRTTKISAFAFLSAKNLKSISLPQRISSIGSKAFYGASSLVIYAQAASKPAGWSADWNTSCPVYWQKTVYNYGSDYQFYIDTNGNAIITRYLGSSQSFTFPSYVELIDSPDEIPVIGIGSGALLGLNFIYSVLIPSNITYMGSRAFDDNEKLTIYCQRSAIAEGWDANWNTDGRPVYWSVNAIKEVNGLEYIIVNSSNVTITRYIGNAATPIIPSLIEGINVTKIGAYAFSASNISGITLPDNLTTIDAYAFAYCTNLASITLPNKVRTIGNYAFAYCARLAIADIAPADGVLNSIGWNAFAGCVLLEQIIIPETVSTMGGQVFKDCGEPVIIVRHSLPSGVPTGTPTGWNITWRLKGYINGAPIYYDYIWQRA